MGPVANILPDGKRLHLQHGPIDLIIGVDGQRTRAFDAATERFASILSELVEELPELRAPLLDETSAPKGLVAKRMHVAAKPFSSEGHLTRMAAVAGSVADEILHAMQHAAEIERTYVNNGGDIALHLSDGFSFKTAIADHAGGICGNITISAQDGIGGIATSGRHGRSHSLGIADSVTVLAHNAASADVAATLIANAVDLPGHPAVMREPANELDEDSDLGALPVVTGCHALTETACDDALRRGLQCAARFVQKHRINSAALFLQSRTMMTETSLLRLHQKDVARDERDGFAGAPAPQGIELERTA